MKAINTLTVSITLGLTVLITLLWNTAPVHAAQLQKAQFEKVEYLNKTNLNNQATQAISQSMAELQVMITQNRLAPTKLIVIPSQFTKTMHKHNIIKATLLAE